MARRRRDIDSDELNGNITTTVPDTREAEAEHILRRINREVVRVAESQEPTPKVKGGAEEEVSHDSEPTPNHHDKGQRDTQRKSLWGHITTGSFLTSSGARQYYRYLVAIAIMCFVSIFLKFMSLNADIEARRMEKEATVLRERAILFKEQRHNICTKSEIERILVEDGVELQDLSSNSRIIER